MNDAQHQYTTYLQQLMAEYRQGSLDQEQFFGKLRERAAALGLTDDEMLRTHQTLLDGLQAEAPEVSEAGLRLDIDYSVTPVPGMTKLVPQCRLRMPPQARQPRLRIVLDRDLDQSHWDGRPALTATQGGEWSFHFDLPLIDRRNHLAHGVYGLLFLVEWDRPDGAQSYFFGRQELQILDPASQPMEQVEILAEDDATVMLETRGMARTSIVARAGAIVNVRPSVATLLADSLQQPHPEDQESGRIAVLQLEEYYPDDVQAELRFEAEGPVSLRLRGKGVNESALACFPGCLDAYAEQFELRGLPMPTCLLDMPGLRTLDLHETNITDRALTMISRLAKLSALRLDSTIVTDRGIQRLAALPALRELRLGHTRTSDAAIDVIETLHELRILSLEFTKITDAGASRLRTLRELRELRLAGTKVDQRTREALRQAIPGMEIT